MADQARIQQHLNAAVGEPLRRSHRPGQGDLQHQVRAALNGGLCPSPAAHHGEIAPLDEIAAHGADDGGVRPQQAADLLQKMDMAHMHRVIFYYYTRSLHKIHLELMTKK